MRALLHAQHLAALPPASPPALLQLRGGALEPWSDELIWLSGWLGFCLSLLNTQIRLAKTLAITQTINNATYALHYSLLGAWSAEVHVLVDSYFRQLTAMVLATCSGASCQKASCPGAVDIYYSWKACSHRSINASF